MKMQSHWPWPQESWDPPGGCGRSCWVWATRVRQVRVSPRLHGKRKGLNQEGRPPVQGSHQPWSDWPMSHQCMWGKCGQHWKSGCSEARRTSLCLVTQGGDTPPFPKPVSARWWPSSAVTSAFLSPSLPALLPLSLSLSTWHIKSLT